MAESSTRAVPDDFGDDRTVVDDMPPMFRDAVPPGIAVDAPERLLDDDTTDVHSIDESEDEDAPTRTIEAHDLPSGAVAGQIDLEALDAKTQRRTRKLPLAAASEALAAQVPRPAISHVRAPRKSRRTPADGVSSIPSFPLEAEPSRPSGSVISSLISDAIESGATATRGPGSLIGVDPDEQPTVDHVKPVARTVDPFEPPLPSAPPSPLPYSARSPLPSGPPPALGFEPRELAALEVDALPDAFKVGRGRISPWVWRGAIVVVAVAIGVLIGLFMLGGETTPTVASMEIVSIPEGAQVSVDGRPQDGVTPMTLRDVQPGSEYRIVIQHEGYRLWDRREQIPSDGRPVKVIASLKPVTVTLHVESTPANAEVFLNGRSVGKTPLTLTQLEPSAARIIELRSPGYAPERRTLDWTDKTEQLQQFTLEK